MSVRFTYTTTDCDLQNPVLGNTYERQKHHALGRTAGGQLFRYAKGLDVKKIKLSWNGLRDDEKDALESFFYTTVSGPSTDFTFLDQGGTSWDARFLVDTLSFETVSDEKQSAGSFLVGVEAYPTTTREKPVWRVELEMEVW